MEEIQDLTKKIDFYNLTYRFKSNNPLTKFADFKGSLRFYKNIKEAIITLEKAEEQQLNLNWN